MDPLSLAMLFGSVGLQFFNNSATNKKAQELRAKQNEAQKAAAAHDFKRMHRLQEQSAKLSLEVEAELHRQRMEDLENNYDTIIGQIAHSAAMNAWPLTILPFVMRGESFGSYLGGGLRTMALHCIFTPSNYEPFNKLFYDVLDFRLEAEMNQSWNAQSSHPVVYYGGCWKKRDMKGTVSCVNLNEIDLLKSQLKALPTMVLTPYFDPKLHFRIKLWGMGKNTDVRLELTQGMFRYVDCYEEGHFPEDDGLNPFYATSIDQFVPYLQSLIGFVADKYFWSMYGIKPMLPEIAQQQSMTKFIFKENLFPIYKQTLDDDLSEKEDYIRAINYVEGLSYAITEEERNQMFSALYESYVGMQGGQDELDTLDLKFLRHIQPHLGSVILSEVVEERIAAIHADEDMRVWFCANKHELYQRIINESEKYSQAPSHFILEHRNDYYAIGCFVCNNSLEAEYSEEGIAYYVVLIACDNSSPFLSIDIDTLEETGMEAHGLFSSIKFDEQHLRQMYDAHSDWLRNLSLHTESHANLLMSYLENAPMKNLTYDKLREWIEDNATESGTVNVIMGYLSQLGRYFFIFAGHACPKTFACYCNTIDDSMREIFKDKNILTIKVN